MVRIACIGVIDSVSLRILTLARDLTRRKARERHRQFVAEGIRAVEELLVSPLWITGVVSCDDLERTERGMALRQALEARGVDILRVSEREFASAADTEHPQGVLAIAEQPELSIDSLRAVPDQARYLVLDGIQDPGNVGTLLRTAAALGVTATFALPGTADLWNAKVVRGAMGAHFRHPALSIDPDALESFLAAHQIPLWGTAMDGASVDGLVPPSRLALAMGNEGAGLSERMRAASAASISLPMAPGVESLNVAVAAGIALFALRPVPTTS